MPRPGLNCSFATGIVSFAGVSPTADAAVKVLEGMVREVQRFQRAYGEGVRSQDAYRLWAAAEEAPPKLTG